MLMWLDDFHFMNDLQAAKFLPLLRLRQGSVCLMMVRMVFEMSFPRMNNEGMG